MDILKKHALHIPDLLLPAAQSAFGGKSAVDLNAWAVVACDQYTQDTAYWQEVSRIACGKPSALHIIFPEIYLNEFTDAQKDAYIAAVQKNMADYLCGGVFASPITAFVYVERTTAYGRRRRGLVACIDLEEYDWKPGTKAKIRATEATIIERIPPRVKIRKNAPLEIPHIMLLVNDKQRIFIEKIAEAVKEKTPLYDTPLMMDSGHICGREVSSPAEFELMDKALASVAACNTGKDGSVFMFAVGDGNHSLATAKAVWEELKKSAGKSETAGAKQSGPVSVPAGMEHHPARYALVEIVNLYDDGLTFEPIHRVIFTGSARLVADFVRLRLGGTLEVCSCAEDLLQKVAASRGACASFGFASRTDGFLCLTVQLERLAVSALQPVLDDFIRDKGGEAVIDYIHGAREVLHLGEREGSTAVLLPPIEKDGFFATIEAAGFLPRKSFSMGEASEKRFYFECRKLTKD